MELSGISALVTGGGSGLGAATVVALAKAGCRVVVFDRNAESASRIAAEANGVASPGDVTDAASVSAALDEAVRLGPFRLVAHCAGVGTASRLLGRDGPHDFDRFVRVIQVNLVGTFNVMRLAAERMSKTEPAADGERGAIITTASIAAYEGQIGQCAYSASKGGVVAMTLPAARELARFGIRVNTLAPGLIDTPLMQELPPDARLALSKLPMFPHRLGYPEEFAAMVLAVATNKLVNGETIRLDGALRLTPT
jgi:NAD(P)-dependent dehydrogenase (short-subunit alcohol dehydrogenase family)